MNASDLLSLTVLAGLVGAVENIFVKPLIRVRFPNLADDQWAVAVNFSTLFVAIFFSALALNSLSRLDLVNGLLLAFNSAMVAIGGYTVQKNVRQFMKGDE